MTDEIIFKGNRVIFSEELKRKIQFQSLGQETCMTKARETEVWLIISAQCVTWQALKSQDIPDLPWSKVGTYLFELDGRKYIVILD